jgi:hypothetical protein
VAEADENGWYDCDVCGRRRHESDRCGCGADAGTGERAVPAGWNPELTAGGLARLPLTGRPAEPSTPPE